VRSGCGWINFPDFKYAFDKAELTKDMIDTTLNYYVKLLKENPTIKAEFDGFATYGEKNPIRLSIERALKIKINLFTMGIDSARIVTKGWGDTRPYTGCSKKDIARMKTQSEKDSANALNRRVEFRVLSFKYKPKSGKE
jgi:outer membrane protein OmpA-like peptidoglycan-associated protein